jgi:hypothetical protein
MVGVGLRGLSVGKRWPALSCAGGQVLRRNTSGAEPREAQERDLNAASARMEAAASLAETWERGQVLPCNRSNLDTR